MTVPTEQELTRLRQRPHRTVAYLAVYEPTTVLAAQIDMSSIDKGERAITVSTISGDHNDVDRGMTAYIGTTPGGRDKGRLRVISATSSTVTVAENAVDWIDGWYLTVVRFFEPWAVFPRIVLNDDNVPIFYKDFDIPYSDQNENFDPVVNMGPHDAGLLTTGAYSVYYSSSGTFDPADGGTPTGYQWYFEGGDPTGSDEKDPGWVHYTGAGHFTTELKVVSDAGKEFVGYRHVMVYDRPGEGPNRPIVRWGIRSFDGSRDEGGYTLSLFVREKADFSRVKDGALIVVFTETHMGGERVQIGGNAENRSDILFVGYVEDESIFLNPVTSQLEFRARSVTGMMESLSTYSATLESKEDPVTWNEMKDMTVDKAIIHFLRWHSTVLRIADFSPTDDDKPVQYIDFARGNLKEAVSELYESSIGAQIVSDRQGKMWAEIDVSLRPTGSRGIDNVLALTDQDWRSEIAIERRDRDTLAFLEMGGIAYSGPTTGSFDAYLSGAPGDVAGYFGGVERTQGLVISSQDDLNRFTGLAYARANAEYPEVTVPIAGDYRVLDIAPQERVLLTLDEDDTFRGVVWDEKPFVPGEIALEVLPEHQSLFMDLTLREETEGDPGVTIEIPEEPPWDSGDLGDWEIDFPPLIPLPPLPPPIDSPPGEGSLVYAVWDSTIARTRNFNDPFPNWESVPFPSGGADIQGFKFHPVDPLNQAYLLIGYDNLYKTNNLNDPSPTWTLLLSDADAGQFGQGTASDPTVTDITFYYIGMGVQNPGTIFLKGQRFPGTNPPGPVSDVRTALYFTFDDGASWDHRNDENSQLPRNQQTNKEQKCMVSPHGNSILYLNTFGGGSDKLWRSPDWGVGWQERRTDGFTEPLILLEIPYISNSADSWLHLRHGDSVPTLYRSNDGGLSVINITPFWGGHQWYPHIGDTDSMQTNENLYTHPRDGNTYAVLTRDGSQESRFARRLGSGGWEILTIFEALGDELWPLGVNPSNENQWMVLAHDNDGRILGSADKGETWTIKRGDFNSEVTSTPGNRRFIGAVWTV